MPDIDTSTESVEAIARELEASAIYCNDFRPTAECPDCDCLRMDTTIKLLRALAAERDALRMAVGELSKLSHDDLYMQGYRDAQKDALRPDEEPEPDMTTQEVRD